MKIAILGTRGIPNTYGGFEQAAEKLAEHFVSNGHDVTVYCPKEHEYKDVELSRIKLKKIFSYQNRIGALGNFVFDFLSLWDASKQDFDVLLELGYAPCGLYYPFINKRGSLLVTNMDGLDWSRSKWGLISKNVILLCEKLASRFSDIMIADNLGIKIYLEDKFKKKCAFAPYGAELFYDPDENVLKKYCMKRSEYHLLIARLEPENNIEMILDGYVLSNREHPVVVVGNHKTKYGQYLVSKYRSDKIVFIGGVYNYKDLCSLRWYCDIYFHGHSVGGTNPSLLEAMACGSFIVAHDNIFNRNVLSGDALYFTDSLSLSKIINSEVKQDLKELYLNNNRSKIKNVYSWDNVGNMYLNVFEVYKEKGGKNAQ